MPSAISRAVLKKKKNRENMSSTLPPARFAESIALSRKPLLTEGFQARPHLLPPKDSAISRYHFCVMLRRHCVLRQLLCRTRNIISNADCN